MGMRKVGKDGDYIGSNEISGSCSPPAARPISQKGMISFLEKLEGVRHVCRA